jgi:aspartate aminotransferase-like enzyme
MREVHGMTIGGGQAELKGKIFRMGTMGDLTAADMLRAFAAFESTLRAHGFACSPETGVNAARAVLDEQLVATH